MAPGCDGAGEGIAIPRRGTEYDYEALKACAAKIKARSSTTTAERDVTISAKPGVPYQVVIATLDAVRRTESGDDLFPEVTFGVAR